MRISPAIKTIILFGALTSLLGVIGYLIGGGGGLITFVFFGLISNLVSYFFGDRIALAMSGAKPLSKAESPEIYQMTEELTHRMKIPMPKLYMSEDMQPNAFATGRGPSNSSVCLTAGLVKLLNKEEIQGVIAHELAHIKNRDILIATIAAVIAGIITSIAHLAMFFGGGDDDNRNPLTLLLLVILAPIAATIIQLAISRAREYDADAGAAKYTRNPQGLANALIKINQAARQIPMQHSNEAIASLYIQNPFSGRALMELFSTHPATEKRVQRLLENKLL